MVPIRDRLPTRRFAYVNYAIIALNILAFLVERAAIAATGRPNAFLLAWGLVPARLLANPAVYAVNVLTSMFLHDPSSWLHLGGNMLFLWIFGDNVEDALGHGRYLAFYLLSGLAGAAVQVLIGPTSLVPMIGASGAIAGVLAAYGSLYPRSPITVLNPVPILWLFWGLFFELPAWIVIAEFFVVNLLNGLGALGVGAAAQGGVAFFAHLGGFVAGLFLVRVLLDVRATREHERWRRFRPERRVVAWRRP